MPITEWNKKYNQPFHFGETISTELANYRGTDNETLKWEGSFGRGVKGKFREQTTPVDYFSTANNFGLSDMHGNVWEWCEDNWHYNYNGAPIDGSAWQEDSNHYQANDNKVVHGGSWGYDPAFCRSAIRNFNRRNNRFNDIGFRVVCVAPFQ